VADCVYLCDLAQVGPVAYQDNALYEYRIRAGQDSMEFPEPICRSRDRELLHYASSDPRLGREARNNMATQLILRTYRDLNRKIGEKPGLNSLFGQIEHVRPEILALGGFFSGTRRFTRRYLGDLKNGFRSRVTRDH